MVDKKEDLSALFEDEPVTDKELSTLGFLVQDMKDAQADVVEQEKILKIKIEVVRKLSQDTIPAVVNATGFSSLVLKSGQKVTVTEEVKASIAKKNIITARKDMIMLLVNEDKDMSEDLAKTIVDAMWKDNLVIEKPTSDQEQTLIDNEIVFDKTSAIHWQTLRKYCKEVEERGQKVPESITVFKYYETKIK